MSYLLKSQRLGFRNWTIQDLDELATMNTDDEVMVYFPSQPSRDASLGFINRMQEMYHRRGFCYFAVDLLETGSFIGFIGLCEQNYEADFTPCIDIGWRLKHSAWGKGYASEGAKACIDAAAAEWGLQKIVAVAPVINQASERVMQKIGMKKVKEFRHPLLLDDKRLRDCVLYEILV